MCCHFIVIARSDIDGMIREVEMGHVPNVLPDWPARRVDAWPGAVVPAIVAANTLHENANVGADAGRGAETPANNSTVNENPSSTQLVVCDMRWGVPTTWSKRPLINARFEGALAGLHGADANMWTEPLAHHRCVLPAWGFFERRNVLFDFADGSPLFLGGVYTNSGFALVTCDPNASVRPYHNRMPLVLQACEVPLWMGASFAELENRAGLLLRATEEETPQRKTPHDTIPGQSSLF